MDAARRIQVRVISADSVLPHEVADTARERGIEARLQKEGVLRDPIMVGALPDVEGYVLLDGTNRKRALANLGYPWILAQIIDYGDEHAVQLRTWCHATPHELSDILRVVSGVEGVEVATLPPLAVVDALRDPSTFAVLVNDREQIALAQDRNRKASRAELLRSLVCIYEDVMTRVECSPEDIETRAQTFSKNPGPATLVAYPGITRSAVVTMAMRGTLIPAGITRHVILCGRALRVNIPLEILGANRTLQEAEAAFAAHLDTLRPRLYGEPTLLFDS